MSHPNTFDILTACHQPVCHRKVFLILNSRIGYHHGIVGFPGLFLAALSTQSFSLVSTGFNAISEAVYGALLKVKLITTLCTTRLSDINKIRTYSSYRSKLVFFSLTSPRRLKSTVRCSSLSSGHLALFFRDASSSPCPEAQRVQPSNSYQHSSPWSQD